ncbi:Tail fiber protein [Campylobacter jejuni]|nr:Tail fiber protein [Campylobacter jejuni]
MSQTVITEAFEQWKAQQAANGQAVVLDEFVFANVPNLDVNAPIDRTAGMPAAAQIVYRQAVEKTGLVNENAVVYSVTLGADVGDFSFNWIGLTNKATGKLAMVVHAPLQSKVKNANGQQGNVLTRSFLMEYNGAEAQTLISMPAETWQIDFTARLAGMDEALRLANLDIYGAGAFFDTGFLVNKTGTQYFVTAGAGYVGGLRAALAANANITVTTKPVKVWADVSYHGTLTSAYQTDIKFTLATTLADYAQSGINHYVFALASIDANGVITDLRPKGSSLYLRRDKNLSDVADPVAALDTLNGVPKTRKINDKPLSADITLSPADVGALPAGGTAVAATKLATARKIAGVAFDGTADISLLPANVGALPAGGTAVAATKLATARKIAGVAFDGTKDIAISAANVDGLGSAATKNVGSASGNVMQVGAFGIGGIAPRTGTVSSNSYDSIPKAQPSGFWTHVVSDGAYAHTITLLSDAGGAANARHLIIPQEYGGKIALRWDNGNTFNYQYFYTDKNKPSATDVGAIPLTGSTAVTGVVRNSAEFQSTSANAYRIVQGDYGSFWRQDGANLYLMLTNKSDQYGGFNTLRPLMVNMATGKVSFGTGIDVYSDGKISCGNTITPGDYSNFDNRYYTKSQSDAGYMAKAGAYTKNESDARYNLKDTASRAVNGWSKDGTTGLITQWGTVTVPASGKRSASASFSYPTTFPNAVLNGVASSASAGVSSGGYIAVTALTGLGQSAGTVSLDSNNGENFTKDQTVRYQVIGY